MPIVVERGAFPSFLVRKTFEKLEQTSFYLPGTLLFGAVKFLDVEDFHISSWFQHFRNAFHMFENYAVEFSTNVSLIELKL